MPFRNTALLRRSSDIDRDELQMDLETPLTGTTVLVVETDRSELERIGGMLEDWHYEVVAVDDGKRALSLVKKMRPALVVTSLELPGLSGVELCEAIRRGAKTANIPCLCVAFPEEIESWEIQPGLFTGEYIQKPVSALRFKRQIDLVLRESRPRESEGSALQSVSVSQIDRYLEEFEQQRMTEPQTSRKKTAKKKSAKKTTKKKTTKKKITKKKVQKKIVPRETIEPVAPPKFVGVDDILAEFGLRSSGARPVSDQRSRPKPKTGFDDIMEDLDLEPSRNAPVSGKKSRPKPRISELDLARAELQSMQEEATPDLEPSNLYEESQVFVLESIRKADQEEGADVQWGEKLVDGLIESLAADDLDLLLKASDREQPFALSAHCVNVAVFALKMAKTLKLDQETQQRLGLAALLHEIGVVKLPKQLVYKQERLNISEVEALRQRPVHSAQMLQILGPDYAWLVEIVEQVYEREDGSGFPLGLAGSAILEEAKIIGASDVFEACIHQRPYRIAMTGYEAVRQLTSEGAELFSDRIVKSLMNSFSLYPYNEYVKLNSGEIGQVVEVNQANLFRPKVKILYDREGEKTVETKTADLAANASLFISQALATDELPQSE